MFNLELMWDRPAQLNSQQIKRRDSHHVLRVRITPAPQTLRNLPLWMAIALDTSGSMKGEKLERAKEACHTIIGDLREIDHLSLACYDNNNQIIIEDLLGKSDPSQYQNAIANLEAKGVTRMEPALDWIDTTFTNTGFKPFVGILITDGHATDKHGNILEDVNHLIEKAKQMKDKGITLCAVGLGKGEDFNTSFLTDLSDQGGGSFIHAKTPDELCKELQDRLQNDQKIVDVDVKLSFKLLSVGVQKIGFCRFRPEYLPLEEVSPNQLNIGTISGDTNTDILIRLDIPPLDFGEPMGERPIVAVELTAHGLETPIEKTAGIIYTTAYSEAQQVNQEVNYDRVSWNLSLYTKELIDLKDNDLNRTKKLLEDIEDEAKKIGKIDIANQAFEQSKTLEESNKLDLNKATELLSITRGLGSPAPEKILTPDNAKLRLLGSSGQTHLFSLNSVRTLIGRNDQSTDTTVDIDLTNYDDQTQYSTSRRHAEISWIDEKLQIMDLDSRNGSYINESKLEPKKLYILERGTKFKLGNLEFEVVIS